MHHMGSGDVLFQGKSRRIIFVEDEVESINVPIVEGERVGKNDWSWCSKCCRSNERSDAECEDCRQRTSAPEFGVVHLVPFMVLGFPCSRVNPSLLRTILNSIII